MPDAPSPYCLSVRGEVPAFAGTTVDPQSIRVGGRGGFIVRPRKTPIPGLVLPDYLVPAVAAHAGQAPGVAIQDDLDGGLDLDQVGLAGDQVGQVAALHTVVETPGLQVVVEVPDVNKVVAQVLQRRSDLLDVAGGDAGLGHREASAGSGPPNLDLNGLYANIQAWNQYVKAHHPVGIGVGLGRRGNFDGTDLHRLHRHVGLEALTTESHRGTGAAASGGQLSDTFRYEVLLVLQHFGTSCLVIETHLNLVGGGDRSGGRDAQLYFEPTAGIGYHRHASGRAFLYLVNDIDSEAVTLVVLAGVTNATYHRQCTYPALGRGYVEAALLQGYINRAGPTLGIGYPDETVTTTSGRLYQGQVHGGRPVAAIVNQHDPAVVDLAPTNWRHRR